MRFLDSLMFTSDSRMPPSVRRHFEGSMISVPIPRALRSSFMMAMESASPRLRMTASTSSGHSRRSVMPFMRRSMVSNSVFSRSAST